MGQGVVKVVEADIVVAHESVHSLAYHAQSFLDNFLKRFAYRHDFADRFHRRAYLAVHTNEFREIPAGNLHDHVVHIGSLGGRVGGAGFADLRQRVAQGEFRGHECQRIARGFRRQRRRAAEAGVDFDYAVIVGLGIEGILYVTFAHYAYVAYHACGYILKHLDLLLAERYYRGHYDALAGVDAQRVEILHGNHGEAEVRRVAYHLELDLFPAFERFLHENLARIGQGTLAVFHELFVVVAYTGTEAAQSVARAHHHGVADAMCHGQSVLKAFHGLRHWGLHINFIQFLYKEVAVLGDHDGLDRCAEHLHAIFVKRAVEIELCAAVEGCLAAKRQQNDVGALFLYHFLYKLGSDGEEIHTVGHAFRCLDCSDVGVNQY